MDLGRVGFGPLLNVQSGDELMQQPQAPRLNSLGQPIGVSAEEWRAATPANREPMLGKFCRLEPLRADRHAAALHQAYAENRDGSNWTYLPYGPFASEGAYHAWVAAMQDREDTLAFAIVDQKSDRVLGIHMVGPDAGEIIQGFGVALKCNATKAQFDATIGIHPTAAEELVTMREPTRA